jgi:hypothetical protein
MSGVKNLLVSITLNLVKFTLEKMGNANKPFEKLARML